MFWCDELLHNIEGQQTLNDSKTPSGRAHVGALRGPLIHDALYRTLLAKGIPAKYLFGVDDYDPLDEIPYGEVEHFKHFLGAPLCNVPPPAGSAATDMADYYITEFLGIFRELGIHPEFYRMRDVYRSGRFNEPIDAILKKADVVRAIYRQVSGSERAENWHPFQIICENCGRIGTTTISEYNGKEVTYECNPHLVKWAQGCGYRGKASPFNGSGKLPWKLEWCAKWRTFPVTIEGAGKDHSTKGGSREVAAACLKAIFCQEPPLNCPYDFFLVGGAKMSSSKGIGVTAREMADFLSPEILRFLLIRPSPRHPVNFEPSEAYISKLFNDFDRYHKKYYHDRAVSQIDKRIYELSEVEAEPDYWTADFQLVIALVQMPHIDIIRELEKRKGSAFTDLERHHLELRIRGAQYWVDHYATAEEKTVLQTTLPLRAHQLSNSQIYFLHTLSEFLADTPWEDEAIQATIFNAARLTPLEPAAAFVAIYRVLLDRDNGPKAGNLLSFLDRAFVLNRFSQLQVDVFAFWEETGLSDEDFEKWLSLERPKIVHLAAELVFASLGGDLPPSSADRHLELGAGVIEFLVTLADGKAYRKRVLFEHFQSLGTTFEEEFIHFDFYAREWLAEIEKAAGKKIIIGTARKQYGAGQAERAKTNQYII